jgi:hypothetical protein
MERQMPLDLAEYERCHFSVTCHTDDLAVVYCLRSLAQYAEKAGKGVKHRQIVWGGTKDEDWEGDAHCITVRFASADNRDAFERTASELLPKGTWVVRRRSDQDPAKPQRG